MRLLTPLDVRLKMAEDVSYVNEDIGIVVSTSKRAPSKVYPLLPASLLILGPAICTKLHVARGSLCKSQSIVRIARERLPEQVKCTHDALPFPREEVGACPQEVGRRR